MPRFTFDVTMAATITVEADDEKLARYWLGEHLSGAEANLGAWVEGPMCGEPILTTVSMTGEGLLMEVDGQAVSNSSRLIPGDVDTQGWIMTQHGFPVPHGDIWVTPKQAEAAKAWGWREVGRDGSLVAIHKRGHGR